MEATHFPRTSWSRVQRAQTGDEPARGQAWNALCSSYWRPAVAYLRALGCAEAEDVAQEFWHAFTRRDGFARVSPQGGTLRSYLKQALRFYHRTWLTRQHRQKRGGGRILECLDELAECDLPRAEAAGGACFDREWALRLMNEARAGLRADYEKRGRSAVHEAIHPFLLQPGEEGIGRMAEALGLSANALAVEVWRARRRLMALLRAGIAAAAGSTDNTEQELRYLLTLLAGDSGCES